MNDLAAIGLVLGVLGILLLALRQIERAHPLTPEVCRKTIHLGMGTLTLFFPWLFASPGSVWILAILATGILLGLRYNRKSSLARLVHGVERKSYGELCFPLGVAFLFNLSGGDPALYLPPLLVLTFADGLAALVGKRYGQMLYATDEGTKSIEGSLTFFLVAFVATMLALLIWGTESLPHLLVLALLFGIVTVVIEAIAWRGLDNLFLPLLGFLFLDAYRSLGAGDLWLRFLILLVLLGFTLRIKKRTTLNDSALIGSALFGYLAWAVGGWAWTLPPLILFLAYPRLVPYRAADRNNAETAVGVLAVVLVGLGLLLWSAQQPPEDIFLWYGFSFAAHLGLIWLERSKSCSLPRLGSALGIAMAAQLILFLPVQLLSNSSGFHGLTTGVAILLSALIHLWAGQTVATPPGQPFPVRGWVIRTLLVLTATVIFALIHHGL